MADPAAAGWLLGSLEGRAKQEELSMGAGDINSPGKIFVILEQHWGEHCNSSTLAGAFFTHQQGLTESVGEYTSNFRLLSAKTRCPGWHPLRSHAAGHFYGWSASCVSQEGHQALHPRECGCSICRYYERGPPLDERGQLP